MGILVENRGSINLCSPSSWNYRPLCPYSLLPSPLYSTVSPLSNSELPDPFCSSSPPPHTSTVVPSVRSRNPSPVSTSQNHRKGRGLEEGPWDRDAVVIGYH